MHRLLDGGDQNTQDGMDADVAFHVVCCSKPSQRDLNDAQQKPINFYKAMTSPLVLES